ncbi:unnamed protein product [Schistocephalus solidus]|uniref:MEDS domain-containing protein n=1 Tax=Schistocephalus solidus TaxID=70667 RepID=A0A183T9I4_SCHSO|nr:unnamed protein product [Schistocephalus solidus]
MFLLLRDEEEVIAGYMGLFHDISKSNRIASSEVASVRRLTKFMGASHAGVLLALRVLEQNALRGVLEKMRKDGWMDRPEVQVRCGRWQDVLPELARAIEAGEMAPFDGVFFDTYAEDDRDLNHFHQFLPRIMSQHPRARYSYYNGMCPDNVFFHGVACETTRLHLERLGFTCEFLAVPVKCVADDKLWDNLSSRYWLFDTYFLPQCTRRPVNE